MAKILVVCSHNKGQISPFISEQVESLKTIGHEIDYFKIKGKGVFGYLKNLPALKKLIGKNNYDIIHAHYGLSGFLANLQRKLPVITTYHGSDVHFFRNRSISIVASRLSLFNILTHTKQAQQLRLRNKYIIQPCGLDAEIFRPANKSESRKHLGIDMEKNIILFGASFNRPVKQAVLAKNAIKELNNVTLMELKGYTREEVALLLNASDVVLITSKYETGPLIAKEALACNTPVVSTDVGDVKQLISGLKNCYITEPNPVDIAEKIQRVLASDRVCHGRKAIEPYELQRVAHSVNDVYLKVLQDKGVIK